MTWFHWSLLCALLWLGVVSLTAADRHMRRVANNNNNNSGAVQQPQQQQQQNNYPLLQQQSSYPQQQQQLPNYPQQQPEPYPPLQQYNYPPQQQQQQQPYPQQQQQQPYPQQQQQQLYPQQQQQQQQQQPYPQQYQPNFSQHPQHLTFPEQQPQYQPVPLSVPQQPYPAAPANSWKYNEYQQQRVPDLQVQQAQYMAMLAGPMTEAEWARQVDAIISRGVLKLSLSLAEAVERDGLLSDQTANVVFSPVNVASALALVLAGSNGTTFQEIATVLGITTGVNVLENRERVHTEFGRFLSQLESQSALVRGNATGVNHVVFANGLFVQNGFNIQQHFKKIAQAYRSEVIPVEFAREPAATKDIINTWFAKHTMGRIRSVLSGAPPTDTRLMIASALFFNGAWEAPFPVEATMTRPFFGVSVNGSKEAFAVYMMTNNMELPMASDRALGCRLLELPYRGRDISMFLLLPDAQGLDGLRQLERNLSAEVLESLIQSRKEAPVIYSLPRMKLERSISLRTALEALGVHSLFDAHLADLSHISQSVVERVETSPPPAPAAAPAAPASSTPPSTTTTATSTTTTSAPSSTTSSGSAATKKPVAAGAVENAIGAEQLNNLYFSSRNKGVPGEAGKANASAPLLEPALAERWKQQPAAKLYVDDVLHKVEVEVTETGTVASAATAITINRDGSTHVMRFNRPFLFLIRHNPTGLVLFYGTVVRPMPEWIVPGVDVNLLLAARPTRPGGNRQPPPPLPPPNRRPAPNRPAAPTPPAPAPATLQPVRSSG